MIDRRIQELVRRLENQELMGRPSRSDAQVARGLRSITERLYKREAERENPKTTHKHVRCGRRLCKNLTDAMISLLNRGGIMKML